tara:strand:+ start:15800 stop:17113 length:1314 start_codon:yes stop_codon:yes gene_type:complete
MMFQDKEKFNLALTQFLDTSPTPFHAVSSMVSMLKNEGFTELSEDDEWALEVGSRHFVTRNGSSMIAFIIGQASLLDTGIKMVGAHTDSPCLMVKPQPEITKQGYLQLGVEVYGGALLNPWFDRDLSVAGRIVYQDAAGSLKQTLVDFKRAVATIPSLAIHLDREANTGRSVNGQTDIPPILMQVSGSSASFRELLSDQFLKDDEKVIDYELCFYDTQRAAVVGLQNEFIASARLDNLLSCFVGIQALINNNAEQTCLIVCNDHEEVGSVSAIGADGPFLEAITARLCGADQTVATVSRVISKSLMISCDNAHATHPNFPQKHDSAHMPALNGGPVVKVNVKQRYATSSLTSSLFKQLCETVNVPVQSFVSRNDMGCGSTIGPITSARLGVATLDVGIPQLAMHSCREMTGTEDPLRLSKVLVAFFNSTASNIVDVE